MPGTAGGIGVTATPNFTSWTSSIQSGATVVVAGDSQQGTYSYNTTTNKVTATTVGAQQPGAVLQIIYSTSTVVLPTIWAKDVTFQTASGTYIQFTRAPDDFFTPADVAGGFSIFMGIVSGDRTKYIVLED
jgi:hypothetical protein